MIFVALIVVALFSITVSFRVSIPSRNGVMVQTQIQKQSIVLPAVATVRPQLKIPVWPVWNGVLSLIVEFLGQPVLAEKMLNFAGGRVIPMSLQEDMSPFLLLVHHKHSFTPFDPFRTITNFIQPEGFPAHPHAGFSTVTITMKGGAGLVHRDSEGNQGTYGDGDVQFMKAGRGTIHEEMWDSQDTQHTPIELFQLWVNSPRINKFDEPRCEVIDKDAIQSTCTQVSPGVSFELIDGELLDGVNNKIIEGPANNWLDHSCFIAHLNMEANTELTFHVPSGSTCLMHLRQGSFIDLGQIQQGDTTDNTKLSKAKNGDLITYDTSSSFQTTGENMSEVTLKAGPQGASALVCAANAIKENVVNRGPFVLSTENELLNVMRYFQIPELSYFWDHKLSDDDWKTHIGNLDLQGRIRQYLNQE